MRRGSRAITPFVIVGLTLLAGRATESASAPAAPAGAVPKDDDFHELLSKPAAATRAGEVPAEVLKAAVERSNAASFAVWGAFA